MDLRWFVVLNMATGLVLGDEWMTPWRSHFFVDELDNKSEWVQMRENENLSGKTMKL